MDYRALPLTAMILLLVAPGVGSQGRTTTLDFVAVGRDGQPVADLTSAEIELKVDGKVQALDKLERRTQADGGRHILLLLDEPTVYTLEPVVRDGVRKLLASVGPGDEVSLVSTRHPTAAVVRGAEAITRALDSLQAGPGTLYSCLSDTLRNIERMASRLPSGRASTVVVIGRGHPEGAATGSEGDAAPCTPRRDAMRKASDMLANRQINVMLFTVDDTNRSWGFETLASNISATSRLLTWADTDALARALDEGRSYYRASFQYDAPGRSTPQRVELKTTRGNVRIHTSPVLTVASATR